MSVTKLPAAADKFCTMMSTKKTLIALFAKNKTSHLEDKIFDGKSAFDLSKEWASSFDNASVCVFGQNKDYTIHTLLLDLAQKAKDENASRVMFAFADLPFLNKKLSEEILETHEKYASEYTFADGYIDGLAPEVIDTGSLNLLCSLTSPEGLQSALGEKEVSRDVIFSVIKTDINSFEIESVLAPKDFRQYRLRLSCDTKANTLACKKLFEVNKAGKNESDAVKICEAACNDEDILHTLPAYYRIQLTQAVDANDIYTPYPHIYKKNTGIFPKEATKEKKVLSMDFANFERLVKNISDFSESAVISLSFGGEPLLYADFEKAVSCVLSYPKLSLLIETSGYGVTEEMAKRISEIRKDVMWIVSIDATDEAMYKKLHEECNEGAYSKAIAAVGILTKYFSKNVYPQFLRIKENEEQLEAFFRFWKEAASPSAGNVLIQKYDHCCKMLADNKVADLSPLERFPCWHLRRDFIVLADGRVPLCQEWQTEGDFIGNVFEEGIEALWAKSKTSKILFTDKCSLCDEYYTFNF